MAIDPETLCPNNDWVVILLDGTCRCVDGHDAEDAATAAGIAHFTYKLNSRVVRQATPPVGN